MLAPPNSVRTGGVVSTTDEDSDISINMTLSSIVPVTTAYVLPPTSAIATLLAAARSL